MSSHAKPTRSCHRHVGSVPRRVRGDQLSTARSYAFLETGLGDPPRAIRILGDAQSPSHQCKQYAEPESRRSELAGPFILEPASELAFLLESNWRRDEAGAIFGRADHWDPEDGRGVVVPNLENAQAPTAAGSCAPVTEGAETATPESAPSKRLSRKIPVAIRRAVWERENGRCGYVSRDGRRCGTRDFLEFHHELPWARCREHRASNIHLRCRAHNQHAAELDFGADYMAACRKRGPSQSTKSLQNEPSISDGNWIRTRWVREYPGTSGVRVPIEIEPLGLRGRQGAQHRAAYDVTPQNAFRGDSPRKPEESLISPLSRRDREGRSARRPFVVSLGRPRRTPRTNRNHQESS